MLVAYRSSFLHLLKRTYYVLELYEHNCFAQNSERKSLNDSYDWLVWSNKEPPEVADDYNLHFDTDMTWANPDVRSSNVILHDLYKINYSWPINSTLAGYWEPARGINYTLRQYKYVRRQDMLGIVFKAGLSVSVSVLQYFHF